MITSQKEFEQYLYQIQDKNAPLKAVLIPSEERTYNIDLNTRTIETPQFLGVEHEHRAECLYFVVDRYFEQIDLSTTVCLIQYQNARNEKFIYRPPYLDIYTLEEQDKIIIPWAIGSNVTAYPGGVYFSFRFYEIDESSVTRIYEDDSLTEYTIEGDLKFKCNLSTMPGVSQVLPGMGLEVLEDEFYQIAPNELLNVYQEIDSLSKKNLYWIDA